MVVLSLALAGCFIDNGGGVTGPGASTGAATTGDPGVTSGDAGETSEDPSATGSTCAGACGGTSDPTTPTGTGDATTGGPTTVDPTGETTTGDVHPTFTPEGNLFLAGAYALARGRYDADDLDDLVVASRDLMTSKLYVVHGAFFMADEFDVGAAISVIAPDLDGDGDSDIVAGRPGAPAAALTFTWDAGVTVGQAIALPGDCVAPRQLAYGLINPDMHVDVLVACEGAGILILPGLNGGTFGMPLQLDTGGSAVGVALADVTGEGFLDIIYLDATNATTVVVRGAGTLNFGANKTTEFPLDTPTAVAVEDIDGDGFLDFVVATETTGCATFRGGDSAPTVGPMYACGGKPQDIALADLDADDIADVVTVHGGELHIGHGVGDGTFSASQIVPAGVQPARVAVGDFNGDLRMDIAVTGLDSLMLLMQSP